MPVGLNGGLRLNGSLVGYNLLLMWLRGLLLALFTVWWGIGVVIGLSWLYWAVNEFGGLVVEVLG